MSDKGYSYPIKMREEEPYNNKRHLCRTGNQWG